MAIDTAALRVELFESFQNLLDHIGAVCTLVRNEAFLPIWVSRSEDEIATGVAMREKAVRLYHTLWYEEGQEGRATLTCPGIVGASQMTVDAAHACNAAKDRFKASILTLKTLSKRQQLEDLDDLHKRHQQVGKALKRMGAVRLNLKQAYRHIPILDEKPAKIGFTWSKQGRTIERTTVAEARRLLERRRNSLEAEQALQRLAVIPQEEVLARVRSVTPHLRANLVFIRNGAVSRRLIQAPLPILTILSPNDTALPEYVPVSPAPTDFARLKRSDVRIEEEPFLPLIRVYRYQQRFRQAQTH